MRPSKKKLSADIVEFTRRALLESYQQEFRENQLNILTARYKKLESYIDQSYIDKLGGTLEPAKWESKKAEWKIEIEQENISRQIDALRNTNTSYMIEGIKLMEVPIVRQRCFR
ncbi:MAG: hypothetical protein HQK51_13300 [Oligoflexia bacterium]|nr:hypothetical protein [Oligoflexia bacterium]